MKLIFLTLSLFLTFLLSVSCGSHSFSQNDESLCSSLNDSTFSLKTVNPWIVAFEEMFGIQNAFVSFSKDDLSLLYNRVGDTSNVRIYFTSAYNDSLVLPGAVIVPFSQKNCELDDTSLVLTAARLKNPGQLGSMDRSTTQELNNWVDLYSTDKLDGLDTVYAYNFQWNHLMTACDNFKSDLWIAFGICNVNDSPSKLPTIHMYLIGNNPTPESKFLDFSRPCPKLCGTLVEE